MAGGESYREFRDRCIVGSNRRGTLKSPTPMQVFRIIVTAEDLPTATLPSSQIVFSLDYIRAG